MQLTDYHALRTGLQRNASPAGDEATSEMVERLRGALVASGLFHTVEVDVTGDIDRLVIALVQFAPDADAARVAWQLERLWHDVIAYPFWSAESLLVEDGHAELQGSTRSSQQGHYVTLHVVAQAAVAPERPAADVLIPTQGGPRTDAAAAAAGPAAANVPAQSDAQQADAPDEARPRRRRLLGRA